MTEPRDRVDLMAPPTPEDPRNSADLLACASDGDATAWEELFRRYNGLVRSTVASFRLQKTDAQDAVQNTWLRVMERSSTIRDPERLGGWLATTASRECLTLIRHRHRTVAPPTASKQLATTEKEPDVTVIAGQASTCEKLIQYLFYEVDRPTDMPQGSIGPTRRRILRELECTLEQRGFISQSGTNVVEDVNWISRKQTEGDRTGRHLLDDLLDQADQALRERLESKVTDIRTGSTQGTGDAQLDDLLQRADAALCAALHEQGTTVSGYLPAEKNDRARAETHATDGQPSSGEAIDSRDPQLRLECLFDPDTLVPLRPRDSSGAFTARGRIDGAKVIAYCTDATTMGGAMGSEGCRNIVEAIDTAVRERTPVIGLWHSGGARLAEGVEALDAVGQVFAAIVRASGRVPQISVVLGAAAGGAAYGPALTDIVIMAPEGRVFVTGPDVVRSVTGEQIDMEALGGPSAHSKKSGVAHVLASSEPDALLRARHLAGLLASPGMFDLHSVREEVDLSEYLPAEPQRAYDVRPLLRAILDEPGSEQPDPPGGFVELQPECAPNVVVGLGRLAGRTIGVIANNPLRLGGCLDSVSAEKASRFVRMCDAIGVPLLVLVDVPGYLPGLGQEWDGVVRRGAKLLHAFAEAIVPRVTLVTRKAFGGAYIAMNSRSLGATRVFAWPDAQVAVMGAKAAVGILHRKALTAAAEDEREALHAKLAEHHEQIVGGVDRAVAIGVVDEVIKPAQTRLRLAQALAAAPAGRGAHGNIPL